MNNILSAKHKKKRQISTTFEVKKKKKNESNTIRIKWNNKIICQYQNQNT